MSGVTMLVRWLCSFPASTLLAQVGRCVLARRQNCLLRWVGLSTLVLPRPQEMHPSATNVNPQAASCPRSAKAASVSVVLLSLDSGQGMHPNSLDKVRVRAVGPSWATSNVPGNRGGLKKKQRQRQTVQTEENSQKEE